MLMRKWMTFLCVFAILTCMLSGASAAGVTLRTFTPFADIDDAAQSYMDMITEWERATGNVVEDYSGLTDEAWTDNMLSMVRAGEADVVVVPLGTGLTYEDLVTVEELVEAVPDMGMRSFTALSEADGSVLLSPLRVSFEALYVNEDVLEANGLSVPQTYEELLAVCSVLSGMGVTPMPTRWGIGRRSCLTARRWPLHRRKRLAARNRLTAQRACSQRCMRWARLAAIPSPAQTWTLCRRLSTAGQPCALTATCSRT